MKQRRYLSGPISSNPTPDVTHEPTTGLQPRLTASAVREAYSRQGGLWLERLDEGEHA